MRGYVVKQHSRGEAGGALSGRFEWDGVPVVDAARVKDSYTLVNSLESSHWRAGMLGLPCV